MMKSLNEVLSASVHFLQLKGISSFRRTAEDVIAWALHLKRMDLYLQFDRPLQEEELEKIRLLLKRAARGEPFAYIVGESSFYETQLTITSDVLIPRPETEVLVDQICREIEMGSRDGKELWDVCTGSGCMGIALKKRFPELQVTLSDLSKEALAVAQENAKRNQVEVDCKLGDLLEPFQGRRADVVLCNPPYVSEEEYSRLDPSVKNFEPRLALVGGEDGLSYYRRLKDSLPLFLKQKAKVFFEIGAGQGSVLLDLFSEPHWVKKRVSQDWSGRDRFFFLEFESVVL